MSVRGDRRRPADDRGTHPQTRPVSVRLFLRIAQSFKEEPNMSYVARLTLLVAIVCGLTFTPVHVAPAAAAPEAAAPEAAKPEIGYLWNLNFAFDSDFNGILTIDVGPWENGNLTAVKETSVSRVECRPVGDVTLSGGDAVFANGGYVTCSMDLAAIVRQNHGLHIDAVDDYGSIVMQTRINPVAGPTPLVAPLFTHPDGSYGVSYPATYAVDVEQRLQTALTLAEKLTAPAMVDKLDRLLALADEAPGMAAMVGDMVDETVRSAAARGVDIEARLRAGLAVAEKLTAPDMVAKLDQLLAFANEAPGLVAMVGDMVDETAVTLDLESRLKMGLQIAEKATQPANLAQLGEMFEVLLEAESGMLSPDAVRTLGSMAQSMVAAKADPRPKVGLLALLRSLNDPDIQNALGFLLNFGKRFGRSL